MAHPSEEIALAWSSLSGASTHAGWRAIPIVSPLGCDLRAGRRSPDNEEAILAGFAASSIPAAEKLPDGQGFTVERVDLGDGKSWLALTRKSSGSSELFLAMACDVIGAVESDGTADPKRLARAFLGRVRAWQEFMRKGAQVLSPEEEIGLFGELAVLRAIIDAGVPMEVAVSSWVGPNDANQDFELGTGAIEVKSTISPVSFPARISSLTQLDDAVLQPLFVVGVRLTQSTAGQSLPEVIASMTQAVSANQEASRLFKNKVFAAGYYIAHAGSYPRKFVASAPRVVEVKAGFPRLTLGTVPTGITEAKYSLDLEAPLRHAIGIELALKKLGAI
jgi:Putative  PD-(D/E)XK family member, (DUF4420)